MMTDIRSPRWRGWNRTRSEPGGRPTSPVHDQLGHHVGRVAGAEAAVRQDLGDALEVVRGDPDTDPGCGCCRVLRARPRRRQGRSDRRGEREQALDLRLLRRQGGAVRGCPDPRALRRLGGCPGDGGRPAGLRGPAVDYVQEHPEALRMNLWRMLERPGAGPDDTSVYEEKLRAMVSAHVCDVLRAALALTAAGSASCHIMYFPKSCARRNRWERSP